LEIFKIGPHKLFAWFGCIWVSLSVYTHTVIYFLNYLKYFADIIPLCPLIFQCISPLKLCSGWLSTSGIKHWYSRLAHLTSINYSKLFYWLTWLHSTVFSPIQYRIRPWTTYYS
jgi:hypothetical protein